MKILEHQQRVLASNKKWNVVQMARGAGKTMLGCLWATQESNQRVIYLAPSQGMIQECIRRISKLYPEEILLRGENLLYLRNGTKIHFFTSGQELEGRGRVPDKIIVDEAGYIPEHAGIWTSLQNLSFLAQVRFLVLGGKSVEGSILSAMEKEKRENAFYMEYSYLDALRDNVYPEDYDVENMLENYGGRFREEFGPWGRIKEFSKDRNKDFVHLLEKREEL